VKESPLGQEEDEMAQEKPPETREQILILPEAIQAELDRRLFHLKTLYDVSKHLLGTLEVEQMLKDFLLMTMGNFGVAEGLVFVQDDQSPKRPHLVSVGFPDSDHPLLEKAVRQVLIKGSPGSVLLREEALRRLDFLDPLLSCGLGFCVDDACCGLLGLGPKLTGETYSADDKDLLGTLVNNLVVSLKNARYSEALKEAYEEVSSFNRAKDKVIDHLSHELKTPISLLKASLTLLERKLAGVSPESWQPTMERARRSIGRLGDMQSKVEDIMRHGDYGAHLLMSKMLDQCADEIEVLTAEQMGEGVVVQRIRDRINAFFGPVESAPEQIKVGKFVMKTIDEIRPLFAHRDVRSITDLSSARSVRIPGDVLNKLVVGLIRNAIENTPDGGKVDVTVRDRSLGVELIIRDTGIGILQEDQKRIFEGFYPTQETNAYASKKPYDFNAGGKGADLLRMKIFSERYHFKIDMKSSRCRSMPLSSDECPGRISECAYCNAVEDCFQSGGTTFKAFFPLRPGDYLAS
jgi:signal transduction histidine kinase